MEFKELVNQAKDDLLKLYLDESDERDWAVAWSGGKDSTCVMGLVVEMLESIDPKDRKRKIHAVMSDTVMENPILENYMHNQVEKLSEYVEKNNLPMTVSIVKRELEQSYFYLVLGRGYFLPQNNGAGRWCTDRLKLKPQNKQLEEINPSYILIGARLSESDQRRQSIEKWTSKNDLSHKIGDHVNLPNSKTFMPIVDFTIEDVWKYLEEKRVKWSSTHEVRKIYRDATGECGFKNPKELEKKLDQAEACGARFGCWTCPVIINDRSTEQMAEFHDWMTPLTKWRMLQIKVFGNYVPPRPEKQRRKHRSEVLRSVEAVNQKIKYITKCGHKRNGNRMTDKEGNVRDDWGTTTVEAREYLLNKLLETEREVNELRILNNLDPIKLISNEEVEMIHNQWKIDRKESPWLVTNARGIHISELDRLIEEIIDIERNQTV